MQQPITIDANLIRAAQASIANNDVRYYLRGFLLSPAGFIVATDGHTLFRAIYADGVNVSLAEDTIIRIDGKIPLNADSVTFQFDTKFCRTNSGKLFEFEVIDGKFPSWERVIPAYTKKGTNTVRLDSTLLARAEKTFGKKAPCDIRLGDDENHAISIESSSIPSGQLVIMPIRK